MSVHFIAFLTVSLVFFQIIESYRDDRCWISQRDGFIEYWCDRKGDFLTRMDVILTRIVACKERLRN